MVLEARVESKEAKGFVVDFGFKDKTMGFMKEKEGIDASAIVGKRVQVIVTKVIASSKIIKCELLTSENRNECVQQVENAQEEHKLQVAQLKPGFLVSAKVSKQFENGVELTFLGGLTGTVFQDHMDQNLRDAKVGAKVSARIISADPLAKRVTLSTLPHIVNWNTGDHKPNTKLPKVGEVFEKATIKKNLYGSSYLVDLGNGLEGFLHKLHAKAETEPEEDLKSDDGELPPKAFKKEAQPEWKVGDKLEQVKVKEINYFDMTPLLSIKKEVLGSENISYQHVKVGAYVEGTVEKVNEEQKYVTLRVNEFLKGNLHIEHMADTPLKHMPPKMAEVGRKIKVRVLSVNVSKRFIEFTKKDSFMKDDAPVY